MAIKKKNIVGAKSLSEYANFCNKLESLEQQKVYHLNDGICQVQSNRKQILLFLVNYVFGTKYTMADKITYLNCRYRNQCKTNEVQTDLVFRINDENIIYHFEFQTDVDGEMVFRFEFYRNAITYNIKGPVIVRDCLIQINGKSGPISYPLDEFMKEVKVVNISELKLPYMLENNLYFLTPFFICRHSEALKKESVSGKMKSTVKKEFLQIYSSLIEAYHKKELSFDDVSCVKSSMLLELQHLTKDLDFIKEVSALDEVTFELDPQFMRPYQLEIKSLKEEKCELEKVNEEQNKALAEANAKIKLLEAKLTEAGLFIDDINKET